MTQLTHDEQLDVIQRYLVAADQDNWDEAIKISQQIPLAPQVAQAFKEALGATFLKNSGYDLSNAEAAYGKDWLAR